MNPNDYLTIEDAAQLLGFNKDTVSRLCRQGKIDGAFRFGSRWLIPKESAEKYKSAPQGFAAIWQRKKQAKESQNPQDPETSRRNAVEAEKERLCKELMLLEEKNLGILREIETIRQRLLRL